MEKKVFQINENIFHFTFYNFMKVYYSYNNSEVSIESNEHDTFPYRILNIDRVYEILYKHENDWYLLKQDSFDNNLAVRCQESEYREYKIELSENDSLILTLNQENKFEDIYIQYEVDEFLAEKFDNCNEEQKQIEIGASLFYSERKVYQKYNLYLESEDPILNLLFSNKWTFYNYNYLDEGDSELVDNKFCIQMIDVKIIEDNTSKSKLKKLEITYEGKQYSYLETEWSPFCCGGGEHTFFLQKQ